MNKFYLFLLLFLIVPSVSAWDIEYNTNNLAGSERFVSLDAVDYYNNNSMPIIIHVTAQVLNPSETEGYISCIEGNINGLLPYANHTDVLDSVYAFPDQTSFPSIYFIVPAYSYYRVTPCITLPPTLDYQNYEWYEWKIKEDTMTNELLIIITFCIVFIMLYILYKETMGKN